MFKSKRQQSTAPDGKQFMASAKSAIEQAFQQAMASVQEDIDESELEEFSNFLGQLEKDVWETVEKLVKVSYKNGLHSRARR